MFSISSDLANTLTAVETLTSEIEAAHATLKEEMGGSNLGPAQE
jgi:hypothetical protein